MCESNNCQERNARHPTGSRSIFDTAIVNIHCFIQDLQGYVKNMQIGAFITPTALFVKWYNVQSPPPRSLLLPPPPPVLWMLPSPVIARKHGNQNQVCPSPVQGIVTPWFFKIVGNKNVSFAKLKSPQIMYNGNETLDLWQRSYQRTTLHP